ncbi:MAG: hypothetical protein NTX65_15625 [Ignavibacteriales bacterium]|nr:hypothetical protein [Ignavibacteriales bacterium]
MSTVFGNSARNIIPVGLNSLVSLFVIKYSSFMTWGELVSYLIIFNLGAQLIGWGSKQYLLREFAVDPANVGINWFENLKARFPLLIFFSLVVLLIDIPGNIKVILITWQSILFISRSFEVLILFFIRMRIFLILEIILSFLLLGTLFYLQKSITIQFVLILLALNESIRLIVYAFHFRKSLKFKFSFSLNYKILSAGFIFFILGTIGMLQTRLDLYFVALLLPKTELAIYQILINYIILIQAATGFVIQPFLKEIYRMNQASLSKFSLKFTLTGLLASIPITLSLAFVLQKLYVINLSLQMIILVFIYIVPIFYYTIRVYLLYKIKKESLILVSGITVLLLSIPLNYYLISILGLTGALISGVAGELLTLMFYFYFENKVGLVGIKKINVGQIELGQTS